MPWDTDWDRGEAGVGYRVARGVTAKVVYQWNQAMSESRVLAARRFDLVAGQISIRF